MPNKCITVITNKEKRYKVIELIHSEKKWLSFTKLSQTKYQAENHKNLSPIFKKSSSIHTAFFQHHFIASDVSSNALGSESILITFVS